MDEVDEHDDVDHEQGLGDHDREVGHEDPPRAADGGRAESERRVHEGRHEHTESYLVADVADEVPHHAGAELLGGEGHRQDRDREDDAHDCDDSRRDRDQDLPARVGALGPHPERKREVTVVGRPVDLVGHDEQQSGDDDEQGRHHPKCRPERFPAPAGELAVPLPGLNRARRRARTVARRGQLAC